MRSASTKTAFARSVGISRSSVYYRHKKPEKDWKLKQQIEAVLHEHPSCGHRRLALHLRLNKKRILRVMKMFGIKPYRRRGRRWHRPEEKGVSFPNLLLTAFPQYSHHIWASDFTHISFHGRWMYLATIIDYALPQKLNTRLILFMIPRYHAVQFLG